MTIPNHFQTEKSGRKWKTVLNIVWTVLIHDSTSDKSVSNASVGDFFPIESLDSFNLLRNLASFGHFFWRINISERHYKRSKKKDSYLVGNTTARRGREITPPINQSINRSKVIIVWRSEANHQSINLSRAVIVEPSEASHQSINRSRAVMVWRSGPIRDSEFDWKSITVHGKGFRRCGLTEPWGRDVKLCEKNY